MRDSAVLHDSAVSKHWNKKSGVKSGHVKTLFVSSDFVGSNRGHQFFAALVDASIFFPNGPTPQPLKS